jgi:hypothetical protein
MNVRMSSKLSVLRTRCELSLLLVDFWFFLFRIAQDNQGVKDEPVINSIIDHFMMFNNPDIF